MSRINCHSAFKHYEMFHGNRACCGGNSYGSVFNTTYNINCGGHHGGFWGGFGMGLGAMVGNWFSGIAGNFGFGGLGGGMGFGFPSFGGGYGNFGNFGGGYNNNTKTDNNKTTTETKEVIKNDPDCAKIADITGKIKNLDENATKEDVQGIIDDIDAAIENLDSNNKPAQKRTLENLKVQMQEKLNTVGKTPATTDKTPAAPAAQTTTPAATQAAAPATAAQSDDTITVGGKPVKIADLASIDGLKGMTDAELAAVTKPQAEAALEKLGYITTDADGNKVGHLSNVYAVLKLLEKSGVTVEVETRSASSDQWVKGPISNVAKDSEGKLSYNVNCQGVSGATLQGNYTFTAQDKENKAYKCATTTEGIKVADIEVNFQGEKQPLINRTAKALAKQA